VCISLFSVSKWIECCASLAFSSCSADLENDPVISFLSSHLATLRGASLARHAARASPAGPGVGDGSRGGGGATLAPEVRQWEVQWGDITIVRPIGRGSFGRVSGGGWLARALCPPAHRPQLAPPCVAALTTLQQAGKDVSLPMSILPRCAHRVLVSTALRTLPPCLPAGLPGLLAADACGCQGADQLRLRLGWVAAAALAAALLRLGCCPPLAAALLFLLSASA
jgi:hypothetical protein